MFQRWPNNGQRCKKAGTRVVDEVSFFMILGRIKIFSDRIACRNHQLTCAQQDGGYVCPVNDNIIFFLFCKVKQWNQSNFKNNSFIKLDMRQNKIVTTVKCGTSSKCQLLFIFLHPSHWIFHILPLSFSSPLIYEYWNNLCKLTVDIRDNLK